jgi:pseudouridine-5'-phosphate glycosidase
MSDGLKWLEFNDEVRAALKASGPVLALESTIITHGMPYPRNLETALAVEQLVRDEGVTPATIAVIDGRLRAGLSHSELETLARQGQAAVKCSRRDLPFVADRRLSGATTVAATMIIAQMAGIRLFATGGIGGVHRGAESSFDVSADLQELARTSVAVVCAGPKSILDIGLTLEYLETHGVPVVGFGTDDLPAFYTRSSGFRVDYRYDSAHGIARVLNTKWSMGLKGGVVIANPLPQEHVLDAGVMDELIDRASRMAEERGIGGKDLTPYLLQEIESLTGGQSLQANIELMLNNARLGARIAAAM